MYSLIFLFIIVMNTRLGTSQTYKYTCSMHIKEAGCGDLCEGEGFLETFIFDILYFLKYWICVSMPSFVKEKKAKY